MRKLKTLIIGAGQMGVALSYAMRKLSFKTYLADPDEETLEKTLEKLESLNARPYSVFHSFKEADAWVPEGFDIVISAAPYKHNVDIAKFFLNKNTRYCDLGGNPKISNTIQKYATEEETLPVFTDLGVAPGLVNIMAEVAYTEVPNAKTVEMRCGGLPKRPHNTLNYNLIFNVDGLYNEYTGKCRVVRNGEIIDLPTLSDVEDVFWGMYPSDMKNLVQPMEISVENGQLKPSHLKGFHLEGFLTKGGLSKTLDLMVERGVQKCDYKTLRFKGHVQFIKFLLEECKLDRESFNKAIENSCPNTNDDVIFISACADNNYKRMCINSDVNWTAMQKGTSFPAAAVAAIMATGKLDHKNVLDYSDVPIGEFKGNLEQICGNELEF